MVLAKIDSTDYNTEWVAAGGSAVWGGITGTVTDQTDLTTYLSSNYYPLSSNPAGYLTSVPGKSVNTLYSSYTLAAGDANNIVYVPSGSGLTITVPDDASYSFPVGTEITVVFDGSFGGTVYFVPQDTMTPTPVLIGQSSVSSTSITTMIKVSANLWVIQ